MVQPRNQYYFYFRMKGIVHRGWKNVMLGMLFMILGSLLLNQALYTHTHVLPDGSIVSHAHPFNKSQESQGGSSHQHSTLEFFLLQNLQILFLISMISAFLFSLDLEIGKVCVVSRKHIPVQLIPLPGRAPPRI